MIYTICTILLEMFSLSNFYLSRIFLILAIVFIYSSDAYSFYDNCFLNYDEIFLSYTIYYYFLQS